MGWQETGIRVCVATTFTLPRNDSPTPILVSQSRVLVVLCCVAQPLCDFSRSVPKSHALSLLLQYVCITQHPLHEEAQLLATPKDIHFPATNCFSITCCHARAV
eukprot:scpid28136/ scgid30841/ 